MDPIEVALKAIEEDRKNMVAIVRRMGWLLLGATVVQFLMTGVIVGAVVQGINQRNQILERQLAIMRCLKCTE